MAGTQPVFYDQASLVLDGTTTITIGADVDIAISWDELTAASTWGSNKVRKPTQKEVSIIINYADMVGNVDYDALDEMADGELHTFALYPEGTAAGARSFTGSAYIRISGLKGSADANATGTLTMNVSGDVTKSPNIVLAATNLGAVVQGAAGSGYTSPVPSGGTSTYTMTAEDENGAASALPYGVTFDGTDFGGTLNAAAPAGVYRIKLKVVDSAATPVVKYFLCTMTVTAS